MEQKEQNQQLANQQEKNPLKAYFGTDLIKQKFTEILGKKAPGFIASILQIAGSNELLAKADPVSIFNAAATAATLDLPLNNNLGFAYIVPYKGKAQFQMGYKGFVQLAYRSGQFKTISSTPIYEGQLIDFNPLTGHKFDFTKQNSQNIIGYAAYFELTNGGHKTLYMTKEELLKHGTKYSQSFQKGFGLWKDDFDAMASKTVLKLLLSKFAPLSIEMQMAVISDQAVINNFETSDVNYVDNKKGEEEIDIEYLKQQFADKGDFLPADEQIAIERIIKNEEKASYKKALTLLEKL